MYIKLSYIMYDVLLTGYWLLYYRLLSLLLFCLLSLFIRIHRVWTLYDISMESLHLYQFPVRFVTIIGKCDLQKCYRTAYFLSV